MGVRCVGPHSNHVSECWGERSVSGILDLVNVGDERGGEM